MKYKNRTLSCHLVLGIPTYCIVLSARLGNHVILHLFTDRRHPALYCQLVLGTMSYFISSLTDVPLHCIVSSPWEPCHTSSLHRQASPCIVLSARLGNHVILHLFTDRRPPALYCQLALGTMSYFISSPTGVTLHCIVSSSWEPCHTSSLH